VSPVLPIPPRLASLFAWLLPALVLLGWAVPAHAASLPALHEVFVVFDQITQQVTDTIGNALGTHEIETVVNVLFTALALGLFVWKFAGYALRGFDMLDLMSLMMTLFFVYLLLSLYKAVFPPIFGAGRYVSQVLGGGISGRPPTENLAEAIFGMVVQVDFHAECELFDCLGSGILSWIAALFAYVIVIFLGIIATLVELWTMWGFQIAFAVGWITVPFLLFERLSFLFDGWLKFFFGMLMYVIVAKVNLALVLLGLEVMFGIAHGTGLPPAQTVPVQNGFFDIVGMLVFLFVGIATLYSTGKFASAIVANAAGGGVGEVVQRVAAAAAATAGTVAAAIAL
jgi:hypothetical protein